MNSTQETNTKSSLRPATTAAWAAATALGAVGTVATSADASIVYVNQTSTFTNTGDTWYLQGSGGSTALAGLYVYNGAGIFASASQVFNGFRFADTGGETVRNLGLGAAVNAAAFLGTADGASITWYFGAAGANAGRDWNQFTIGTKGYFGFRFDSGSGTEYGWAQATILPGAGGLQLTGWAYETTPGVTIAVGAVPEPTTNAMLGLGALALGIGGMRAYKKQRSVALPA